MRRSLQTHTRHMLLRAASWFAPPGDEPLPDLRALERILIVYVNFRLGNTLLATPGVEALTRALPGTRIDLVGGPSAPAVFRGFGLERIFVVDRHDYFNIARSGYLLRRWRDARYDAAIHMGTTSAGIGAFTCRASRAPIRIGCRRPQGNVYFTSTVEAPPIRLHKVERLNHYVRSLGLEAAGRRRVIIDPQEQQAAAALLATRGEDGKRVAVFLSGRRGKGKNWTDDAMAGITSGLREQGLHPVVVFGPEERGRVAKREALLGDATYVRNRSLREVAAIVQQCNAAIAPDSGPMHLAIAVGTRTVGLFRRQDHAKWGPQQGEGFAIHDPAGKEVARVLDAVPDALRRRTPPR